MPSETAETTQAPEQLDSFELRILDPARTTLRRIGGLTRLTIEGDRSWTRANPARAFPVSDPDHYIGFLDGAGKDIGILKDPTQLDEESQRILAEDLEMRYFVPVVTKVNKVKVEFGAVYWTVETTRGPREVIVRNLRDNLQELSATRVLVTDVDGNRIEFPDVNALDAESQGVILRHL
ncbi:MAG: DUF1854 domain-containing protein [Chthonomonadales bacterium]|nr:DUF1854 domain-containing protein [Chthonomonadales bacterium]